MKLHFDPDWLRRMTELGDDEMCMVGPPMTLDDLKEISDADAQEHEADAGDSTRAGNAASDKTPTHPDCNCS